MMRIGVMECSSRHGVRQIATTMTRVAIFVCLASLTSAIAAEPPRVFTNDDLPEMPASRTIVADAGSSSVEPTTSWTLDVMAEEMVGVRGLQRVVAGKQPTVPELLQEAERLQKRRMGLLVPFISRRFAAPTPEEREEEKGLDNRARVAKVQSRLDEVLTLLREAGAEAPSLGFGRPAPLIVVGLGESPAAELSLSGKPEFPQETVAGKESTESLRREIFRDMDELQVFVTVGEAEEPRWESIFSAKGEGVPILLPY